MRDWVAEDDLVHFVIKAVERLPLSTFAVNHRGSGDAQFPPAMMRALLIYCYANGVFSSRRIERATHRDVAVRYLCADTHPDHDTICTFRRNNLEAVAAAFVDVLELARDLRLLKLDWPPPRRRTSRRRCKPNPPTQSDRLLTANRDLPVQLPFARVPRFSLGPRGRPWESRNFYPCNYPCKYRCISVHKPAFLRHFAGLDRKKETARKLLSASRSEWLRG